MSDVKNFISELGLAAAKTEGKEIVCSCPWCGSDTLSVNSDTGLWRCFHGCGSGNAWSLAGMLRPGAEKREIVELLKKHGLFDGKDSKRPEPKKKTWPRLKPEDHRPMLEEEIEAYCTRKNIDVASFKALEPRMLAAAPFHVLIPGYDPTDMSRPRAYLRDTLDGSPILIDGEPQKYPLVPKENPNGTNKALVGLNATRRFKDLSGVVYAEGWKDALAAMSYGLPAVANSHGAGSWDDDWLGFFKDKVVWIVFDADNTGVRCGARHAERIRVVAKECRIVHLPYEVVPKHGPDLHDYIREDKHTKEEFYALLDGGEMVKRPAGSEAKEVPAETSKQLPDDYPDTIAAQVLSDLSKPLKYNIRDGWTVYEGGVYRQLHEESVRLMASRCMNRYWWLKGKRKERVKTTKHNVGNVLAQISYMEEVWVPEDQSAPCSMDGTIQTDCILNLQNGLLDWSVYPYRLMDHTPQFYTLNQLPYEWKGEKESDRWIDFLLDVTSEDPELCGLLQQWAGYCLIRHGGRKTRFLMIYGESDTGKSVFVDTLAAMLGRENVSNVPLEMFENPHYIYSTYGKLLNISDESEDNILEPAVENNLKNLTGGTMVQFKRLYHDAFSAYPTAKFIISTNHLPRFKDTSEGIWNRMLLVPFQNVIPREKQDPDLKRKFVENEMPGILAWALKGARNLIANGFNFLSPDASQKALMEYKIESHPEYQFLTETFERVYSQYEFISCQEVYDLYKKWSDSNGFGCKNIKNFGVSLRKLFPHVERKRIRQTDKLVWVYDGLGLKSEVQGGISDE